VRIEPRQVAEKQAETEAWRDVKVGCWYEAEPVPACQQSLRQRAVNERGQVISEPPAFATTAISWKPRRLGIDVSHRLCRPGGFDP